MVWRLSLADKTDMQKPLADVIAEISRSGSTGILSLGVKNDSSLFKIFFRAGAVYHMTHGTCRDTDCLTKFSGLDFDSGFFMSGARVDMPDQALPRTDEIIAQIRNSGKTVRWEDSSGARTDISAEVAARRSSSPDSIIDAGTLARMEEELLNIAGPVAQMVLDSSYSKCNLKRGTPIRKLDFKRLIEMVCEGLPEEQKTAFISKFS